MSLDALIMLAGALIALIPFLGFTVSMQMWIIFILGLLVIALGIAVRRRGQKARQIRARKGEFVESVPAGVISYDIEARNDKHIHPVDEQAA
jgi:Flp pilus assembly protein TadB